MLKQQNKEQVEKLMPELAKENLKAVIIPHISPDGDAIGSCSALSEVCRKAGIECHILICDYIPEYLRFLKIYLPPSPIRTRLWNARN